MGFTKTVLIAMAGVLALSTNAAPLEKRIAQVIVDSTKQWVDACTAAGGADKCGTTSQTAFMTLLAAADDCAQQNAADAMIDLAKSLNNNAKMIALAQIFAQQPRNSPDKLSVNYCQQQPKNAELQGLFQCQFQGVDPQTFTKNVKVGGKGTIPLGLNAPLDPPGSCKANPQGGIADGSQLVDLTQDPGVGNKGDTGNSSGTANAGASSGSPSGDSGSSTDDSGSSGDDSGSSNSDSGLSGSDSGSSGSDSGSSSNGSGDDNSGSTSGDCNGASGSDAGSAGTGSGAGSNSSATAGSGAGTANASDGSTASEDGSNSTNGADASTDSGANASSTESGSAMGASATSGAAAGGDFKLQNGKDAQAQNAKFASLTDASTCKEGDQACINGGFAQCVGGKFQTTQCAGGTKCFALPLVNSAGTSIACTTEGDAQARVEATGATGGPTGA